MTEKMGNTEHKEEDSFALYTEKIVPKPSVKYRRLIRAAKFFVAAVLFGLIASGVMLLVYPALEKRMVQRNTDKEILTIEKDEYPSEEQDNTETKETTADDNYEAVLQTTDAAALKNVATAAIKSLVLIDVYKTDMGNILTETQSATETVGLVIGQVNSEYIILTNAEVVRDSSSLVVKVSKSDRSRCRAGWKRYGYRHCDCQCQGIADSVQRKKFDCNSAVRQLLQHTAGGYCRCGRQALRTE